MKGPGSSAKPAARPTCSTASFVYMRLVCIAAGARHACKCLWAERLPFCQTAPSLQSLSTCTGFLCLQLARQHALCFPCIKPLTWAPCWRQQVQQLLCRPSLASHVTLACTPVLSPCTGLPCRPLGRARLACPAHSAPTLCASTACTSRGCALLFCSRGRLYTGPLLSAELFG